MEFCRYAHDKWTSAKPWRHKQAVGISTSLTLTKYLLALKVCWPIARCQAACFMTGALVKALFDRKDMIRWRAGSRRENEKKRRPVFVCGQTLSNVFISILLFSEEQHLHYSGFASGWFHGGWVSKWTENMHWPEFKGWRLFQTWWETVRADVILG